MNKTKILAITISSAIAAGLIIGLSFYAYNYNKNMPKPQKKIEQVNVNEQNIKDNNTVKVGAKIPDAQQNNIKKENVKNTDHSVKDLNSQSPNNFEVQGNSWNSYDSYVLSPTVTQLDKTDFDTDYWWNTSESNLLEHLKDEYQKYKDPNIKIILDNAKNIPEYLIDMAVMHPEYIPYVAGYQNRKLNQPIDISKYYEKGKIPLFEQYDKQWGYDKYGLGPIAMDGCGPTSLAMVVVGVTGNTKVNPRVVAEYGQAHGSYTPNVGSNALLMTSVAEHFGLTPHRIQANQVVENLKEGRPIIAALGPGKFTLSGHVIVLVGITKDGKIIINNPDSVVYSREAWNLSTITDCARGFWSYTKA
ncbi:MAG: C39 family peptidase [Sarcina sp.]